MTDYAAAFPPGVQYENGFLIGKDRKPYYSFCTPDSQTHWTEEMDDFIAEASKDHFIDRYNRKIVLDALISRLRGPGALYMDIGCSSGYMLEDVIAACPQATVYGSDYLANGLLQCHKTLPEVPLFQMDITDCKFPTGSFDALSCLNVLEHVTNDVAGIVELHRILKPGGRLVATVPVGPHLYDLYDEIHLHVRRYTLSELTDKFRGAGFQVLKANHFGVAIYPAFYLRKKLNRALYRHLSIEEKKKKGMRQAQATGRLQAIEKLCDLEAFFGKFITYPFGVRAYLIAQK